jgi:RNA polymerase sigma-70 factor, ECF subfamily
LAADVSSPSHVAMREETCDRLDRALQSMDTIDREVLALRHFEELTNSETAEVLGIQQKAASIRYVRALKRLKAILADSDC